MTIAYSDLETQLDALTSGASAPQSPVAQLLIVARTWEFGTSIKLQMAQDESVKGTVRRGTLTQIAARQDLCAAADFLVFEARADAVEADCAALRILLAHGGMQAVAMVTGEVTPALSAAYLAAGVSDVLPARRLANEGTAHPAAVAQGQGADFPATGRLADSAAEEVAEPSRSVASASASDLASAREAETLATDDAPLVGTERAAIASFGQMTLMMRARGGAGASTVATNLAIAQSRFGTVALVDLDLQNGTIATLLDLPDSAAFTQLIRTRGVAGAGFCARAMVRHSSGIEVLAAPDVFAPMTALSSEQVADLIETLRTRYDHVIVDLPQAVMDWFAPLLDMASRAVIVTDTSVPSIKRAKRLIEVLTEDHMTLPVTVVVNAEKRPLIQSAALKEAARLLDRALTHWIPFDAAAMRRARDMGVPVILGAKRSGASRAITALADALHKPKTKGAA